APKKLPCRISIKISGVEAFMYNRSPAYDGIIDAIRRKASDADGKDGPSNEKDGPRPSMNRTPRASTDAHDGQGQHHKLKKASANEHVGLTHAETDFPSPPNAKKSALPSFLRLLPIYVDCSKG